MTTSHRTTKAAAARVSKTRSTAKKSTKSKSKKAAAAKEAAAAKTAPFVPWSKTFTTLDGERITLFRAHPVPSPSKWWTQHKPSSFHTKCMHPEDKTGAADASADTAAATSTTTSAGTKRKAADADEEKEQPATKRARSTRSASWPRPTTTQLSQVRTRSQVKAELASEPVPLSSHTSPLPPAYAAMPAELSHIVPQFQHCGGHNCGQHEQEHEHQKSAKRKRAKWLVCRDCRNSLPPASMHALPCGHALCRACLNDCAGKVKAVLASRATWAAVVQPLLDRYSIEQFFGGEEDENENENTGYDPSDPYDLKTPSPVALSPSPEAEPTPRNPAESAVFRQALQALGLTCCGRDSELGRHMACMDAGKDGAAPAVWLVDELLQEDPELYRDNRCGWPDCRALLAPSCEYRSRDGLINYYCVQCSGVSMAVHDRINVPARS